MAQRQFRSDDTSSWTSVGFGSGEDGSLNITGNTTESPIDSSCSGTSGTTSLSATNASFATGQVILIHQSRGTGEGTWELNKIASYTAGTITTLFDLTNTYTDSGASQAQVRVLKQHTDVTISATYTAKAWDGNVGGILAFLCNGTTTVTGTVTASGKGFLGHAGHSGGDDLPSYCGEGTTGASAKQSTANGNGSGAGYNGGGEGGKGAGAGGGNAAAGTAASGGDGGAGGLERGSASLTDMVFGGASGAGGGGTSGAGKSGVNGGGIILIITKDIVSSSATGVYLNGTAGIAGQDLGGGHYLYGSGGGAGGSCLIKCQTGVLGTTKITATGGAGGAAVNSHGGGAGSVGRIHVDYLTSLSGSTTPTLDSTEDATLTTPANYNAVGGIITEVAGNRIHTFNSSGDFVSPGNGTIESLIVAGGGSGGGGHTSANEGGGGGAGGLIYDASSSITEDTYTVTIGAGGSNASGGNSSFNSQTAIGGGRGGFNSVGSAGGSGGGGSHDRQAGGAGTAGQGYAGGTHSSSGRGGGGGGAGEVGDADGEGYGGDGVAYSISGASVTYAGGGGGCNQGSAAPGGDGGGGNGATSLNSTGTAGTANRGGGGGGSWANDDRSGGNGGSGIVIISYEANTIGLPSSGGGAFLFNMI